MLSERQIKQLMRVDLIKERYQSLERDYLLQIISKKQYNKEKEIIDRELSELEYDVSEVEIRNECHS